MPGFITSKKLQELLTVFKGVQRFKISEELSRTARYADLGNIENYIAPNPIPHSTN